MTRTRMRGLALGFLLASLSSCVGTGFVPNRRDSLDEAAWYGLFAAGLVFFVLSVTSLRTTFGQRAPSREVAARYPSWVAPLLGPLLGAVVGFKSAARHAGPGDPLWPFMLGGVCIGLAAGGCVWFMDYVGRFRFQEDAAEPGSR